MTNTPQSPTPPTALTNAVRRVLRPLVRGFIRFGLTWPMLSDILKRTYVDIANEDFADGQNNKTAPAKPLTDSRISLLTRIHRKDIRRFRLETAPPSTNLANSSVSAQIIARWQADKAYLDKDNQPKPLPRLGPSGFDQLATNISKDTHPRAILEELLRVGAVHIDDQDRICLDSSAFVPSEDFDALAWYYGLNLHDHIAASTHNISGGTPAFLDRSVHYSGLTQKSVSELEQLSKDLAMEALLSINAKARALAERDKNSDKDGDAADLRMTFGAYFYATKKDGTENLPLPEPLQEPSR